MSKPQKGMVTFTFHRDVILKIIAGSGGENSQKLVDKLMTYDELPSPDVVYNLAKEVGFGTQQDLVVLHANGFFHRLSQPLSPEYRRTFVRPRINPQWSKDNAPKVTVIELSQT